MRAPKIISDFMLDPPPLNEWPNLVVFGYEEDRGKVACIMYSELLKPSTVRLIERLINFPLFMSRNS